MVYVVFGAATLLYAPVLAGMVRQWWTDPASSHGLLLVAVALFVAWRRREQLYVASRQPRDAGIVGVVGGLLVFAAGTVTGDVFILRVSLPIVLAGAALALGGTPHLKLLAAPIALLALAIPLPAVVVTHATMPLQLIASQVAAGVLQAMQVPVLREGNLLMLERVTLEVADACSGLRSLVSLVSLAAVCGVFFSLNAGRTILLLAGAVPIAIVGNGLRVAATGLMSTVMGQAAARGLIHDVTGYAAFVAMGAAIVALQMATRPRPAVAGV